MLRRSAPPAARPHTRAATPRATPHRVHRPRGCAAARSCARKVHARQRARWHRSLLCFRTVHSARAERSERRRIGSAGSAGVPVDQCRPTCDDRLTHSPSESPKFRRVTGVRGTFERVARSTSDRIHTSGSVRARRRRPPDPVPPDTRPTQNPDVQKPPVRHRRARITTSLSQFSSLLLTRAAVSSFAQDTTKLTH